MTSVVEAPTAACASCGAAAAVRAGRVRITPDRLRGEGELVWSVCEECASDAELADLDRIVVVRLLGVDPEDPALDGITIVNFCEHPGARPDAASATPWAHVDRASLAQRVQASREARERRACPAKQGCCFCGVSHTPPGTVWRELSRDPVRWSCGRCSERRAEVAGGGRDGDRGFRDLVAAVLCGYERSGPGGSVLTVANRLGTELGILMAWEAGVTKGTDRPWAHVDVEELRARAGELAAKGHHGRPRRVSPVSAVRW